MLTDKSTIQQILGCLMKHPSFLSEIDKYTLTTHDFSNRFEAYIFNAIYSLYFNDGVAEINPIDIDQFLQTNSAAHKLFESQNGLEYLQDIIEFSNLDSFGYYYNKLKKLNLLKDLTKQGIAIDDFYIEDLTNPKALEINSIFEQLTTTDIINKVKTKLLHLENNYAVSEEVKIEKVSDDINDFVDSLIETIEIGKPIQGKIYNQVINGAEKGALTIRSGSSGLGKTRQAIGDACYLAYPLRFNWEELKWEKIGNNEKVLFIVTEQTFKQVKKMILAYITGINDSKFKYNYFTETERIVIDQATEIIKKYEDNLILIKIPNPSIDLLKNIIREQCLLYNIDHVFYDYIFIGPALLNEYRGFSLRNDEVLLMFATALKDLAVELNVSMMTSTQVNAQSDDNKNIRNEAALAGGRATINKADNGAIMARPTKEELDLLHELIVQTGTPNMVTDIFKVRSGQWSQVRIWSKVDLGTMRKEDLFITDARLDAIDNFFDDAAYEVDDWSKEEFNDLKNYIELLNGKVKL